jgi:hypothetical protein
MGPAHVRPCPSCGQPLELPEPLVTCPACDRDFEVEVETVAEGAPYRGGPLVALRPGAKPPPPGAALRDLGTRVRIGRGEPARAQALRLTGAGLGLIVVFALLVPHHGPSVLVALLLVWFLMFVFGTLVGALVTSGLREEISLGEGVLGWRTAWYGIGCERRAALEEVSGVHLRDEQHRAFVEVRFRSGETWQVARAQDQGRAAMSWLARRLRNVARPGR